MTDPVDIDARQVARLHEQLQRWLTHQVPRTPPLVIVSALSYEIARQVHLATKDAPMLEHEMGALLAGIATTMLEQWRDYRDGTLSTET